MSERKKKSFKHLWMVEDVHEHGLQKSYWTKIGVAFENQDGSWSLEFSAIPMTGRVQMRDVRQRESEQAPTPPTHHPEPTA